MTQTAPLPRAGEKISPFTRIPQNTSAPKYSPFVRGPGIDRPNPNAEEAPEWPKMVYHSTLALDGKVCNSQEEFDDLPEGFSLEMQPAPPPPKAPPMRGGGGADTAELVALFDRNFNRLQDKYDTLEADNRALQQENAELRIEVATLKAQPNSKPAQEAPKKSAAPAASPKENPNVPE